MASASWVPPRQTAREDGARVPRARWSARSAAWKSTALRQSQVRQASGDGASAFLLAAEAESWIRQQPPEQIYAAVVVLVVTILVFIAGVVSNLKFLLPYIVSCVRLVQEYCVQLV
jgi:hypothetical protein